MANLRSVLRGCYSGISLPKFLCRYSHSIPISCLALTALFTEVLYCNLDPESWWAAEAPILYKLRLFLSQQLYQGFVKLCCELTRRSQLQISDSVFWADRHLFIAGQRINFEHKNMTLLRWSYLKYWVANLQMDIWLNEHCSVKGYVVHSMVQLAPVSMHPINCAKIWANWLNIERLFVEAWE